MNSVFEIIGPPMIGPSSSHTAGAVRVGLMGSTLLGSTPIKATIGLHGSFASTGRGHATDRGLVAGLLGWNPDDERLKDALTFAEQNGLAVKFEAVDLGESAHPNSVRFSLTAADGKELTLTAASVGGGSIEVSEIDQFQTLLTGSLDALVLWHHDKPGFLAHLTAAFACVEANIATIRTARRRRGAEALTVVELDAPPQAEVVALLLQISHVSRAKVVTRLI